jgi:cell division protein FtsA
VVFFEGAVAHTGAVPIGGMHFTNDLAICLHMPLAQAEELKRQWGHAVVTAVPSDAEIEIANPQPERLSLRRVAEVLEPRARELFHYVRDSLRQGGVFEALGAGCVLTGGGALLPGMLDQAESQLRVPARTGNPVRLSNMPGELASPMFSTVIGMLLYAHRTRVMRDSENNGLRAKLRAIFAQSF